MGNKPYVHPKLDLILELCLTFPIEFFLWRNLWHLTTHRVPIKDPDQTAWTCRWSLVFNGCNSNLYVLQDTGSNIKIFCLLFQSKFTLFLWRLESYPGPKLTPPYSAIWLVNGAPQVKDHWLYPATRSCSGKVKLISSPWPVWTWERWQRSL